MVVAAQLASVLLSACRSVVLSWYVLNVTANPDPSQEPIAKYAFLMAQAGCRVAATAWCSRWLRCSLAPVTSARLHSSASDSRFVKNHNFSYATRIRPATRSQSIIIVRLRWKGPRIEVCLAGLIHAQSEALRQDTLVETPLGFVAGCHPIIS